MAFLRGKLVRMRKATIEALKNTKQRILTKCSCFGHKAMVQDGETVQPKPLQRKVEPVDDQAIVIEDTTSSPTVISSGADATNAILALTPRMQEPLVPYSDTEAEEPTPVRAHLTPGSTRAASVPELSPAWLTPQTLQAIDELVANLQLFDSPCMGEITPAPLTVTPGPSNAGPSAHEGDSILMEDLFPVKMTPQTAAAIDAILADLYLEEFDESELLESLEE